jgi:hypothetical protein
MKSYRDTIDSVKGNLVRKRDNEDVMIILL